MGPVYGIAIYLQPYQAMRIVGYPMAVGDACVEVRERAIYVTHERGGRGAVREAVEHLLKAAGLWGEAVELSSTHAATED